MKLHTARVVAIFSALTVAALLPASASAQGRGQAHARSAAPQTRVVVGVGVGVGVGGGYYRPYYRPYYYRPYYYGYYGAFYGAPFYYPYGWQYPYYGYGGGYDISASLRLQVTPRNTEVFIDGYFAGTVDDFDGFFQRLNIEPGEHDLELFLAGHRAVVQKVYLQTGNTFRVKHAMEPLGPGEAEPARPVAPPPPQQSARQAQGPGPGQGPGPASRQPRPPRAPEQDPGPVTRDSGARVEAYGTLTLRVQPGAAEIRIDGERWEGPQGDERLVVQLATGRHVIDVQKDGYRQYTTEVTVRSDETATLNVALTRQ